MHSAFSTPVGELIDFYGALHDRYNALSQECQYIPSIKSAFTKLCTEIGDISKKIDRLELALDMALDLADQRKKDEWERARDIDIAQLRALNA